MVNTYGETQKSIVEQSYRKMAIDCVDIYYRVNTISHKRKDDIIKDIDYFHNRLLDKHKKNIK